MDSRDYQDLYHAVFFTGYPGYRPEIVESPHGDGNLDSYKRYAHVALKYEHPRWYTQRWIDGLLMEAHRTAVKVARALNVPEAFMPKLDYGCLRVLEYPAGAGSHEHEDFDLFTLMLYRNAPEHFVSDWHAMPEAVKKLNAQCHLGQLATEIGLGPATKHSVTPCVVGPQHSIVYFAIPDHAARLPSGVTVGEWIAEATARHRSYR
jgi:hypothetical protein